MNFLIIILLIKVIQLQKKLKRSKFSFTSLPTPTEGAKVQNKTENNISGCGAFCFYIFFCF